YGLAGSLVVVLNYTEIMKHWFGGALHMWLAVWLVSLLVIVPMGLRDIVRAAREPWADLTSRGGVRQAMVEIRATTPDAGFSVESRPNCSLSWLGTVYLFAIIALYALVIAMGFALIGAWPVTRA
ncbi:MAG TPA: DUF2244 domain-containing protein, partial [Methylophilaceae bacterium]|nr:DUF2244 domain-containing protein [Methylophilaceae bacterium]